MAGKIDLYNLGSVGVDLTKSDLHKDDGSLVSAQNAVPDNRGQAGGITKRDGLTAINGTTAGGSVQGAVHVPLPATKTLYLVGSSDGGANAEWASSTDSFATISTTEAADLDAGAVRAVSQLSDLQQGDVTPTEVDYWAGNPVTTWKNKIVFANNRYRGLVTQAVSVFDGTTYREIAQLPINPDVGAAAKGIIHLLGEGEYVYVAVWDAGTAKASHKGSVYRLSPTTGQWLKLGATFPTGFVPSALCWYLGRLWAGTYSEDRAESGRVYWIRPGIDSAWTLDHTTTAGQGEIFSLAVYKGELYAATRGDTGTAGLVKKRTTTGTWSTSLTGYSTARAQGYLSLCTFGANLYAAYYEYNASSRISKFDGSSWSTVLDFSGTQHHYMLYTDGSIIVAQDIQNTTANDVLYTSANGSSWTDRSSVAGASAYDEQRPGFGVIVK